MNDFMGFYSHFGVSIGLLIVLFIILSLGIFISKFRENGFIIFFENIFEKIYEFFEDILGQEEKSWIKVYVTILFFIILFSNILSVFVDFLKPIFGEDLQKYIDIPTADINFNIAISIVGVIIVIFEQFRALGFKKAIYEYFPFLGKGYIPYERGVLNKFIDLPLFLLVKFFDIVISLFLGLLEIVGHMAKIISLSFRLFGNVTSGGILLAMLITGMGALTTNLLGFDFPVLGPIILYLQGLLVALIQALVFPLLIAIFIKVAKMEQ
ncbi:MAG: F0F1 ATP synthase subunit A [Candidatus Gracilibacteria bacterium]|nr:F0F1 ATP synthase subunit A [Candidatus Gracilibacteria bacterium]